MADIFGAVWTAAEITCVLIRHGNEVKEAKESMRRLSDKIEAIDGAMKQVDKLLSTLTAEEKTDIDYDEWISE